MTLGPWRMPTVEEIHDAMVRSEKLLDESKVYVDKTQIRHARRLVKSNLTRLTKALRHLRMLTKMLEDGHDDVNPNAPAHSGRVILNEP